MSSFLKRDDPRHIEITETLLQLQQIMNKKGFYEPLARRDVQNQLNKILMKVSLFSYLKENWEFPIFAHPGCYEVLEIICGINRSVGYSTSYPETIKAYEKIEQLRDRFDWRKISFNFMLEEEFVNARNSKSFFNDEDATFVVVASTDTKIFEGKILVSDLKYFDQFFRLEHKYSDRLLIDFHYNANRSPYF